MPLDKANGVKPEDSSSKGNDILTSHGNAHVQTAKAKLADLSQNGIPAVNGLSSADNSTRDNSHDIPSSPPSSSPPPPIAIVGMSMRLPGGVNCAEDLWKLLVEKKDGHCHIPDSRYSINAYDNLPGALSSNGPHSGYFLPEDPAYFDADFFSISGDEAARLDPQQRLLLEVIWECMENGGQTSWRGKDIGCFVGVFAEDWLEIMTKDVGSTDRYNVLSRDFALSNRISYEYDLKGPR